jgi:hypothetical protein
MTVCGEQSLIKIRWPVSFCNEQQHVDGIMIYIIFFPRYRKNVPVKIIHSSYISASIVAHFDNEMHTNN